MEDKVVKSVRDYIKEMYKASKNPLKLISCPVCDKTWIQDVKGEALDSRGYLATTTEFNGKCFIACNCNTVIGYVEKGKYYHNKDFEVIGDFVPEGEIYGIVI